MEFFRIAEVKTDQDEIRRELTIDSLPSVCEAVDSLGGESKLGREIYFLEWGLYHIRRDEVMGGVRFWVPDCPNALAFTVTTGFPPEPGKVVIHATINRTEHDPSFIAATEDLVDTLAAGLGSNGFRQAPPSGEKRRIPAAACTAGGT
jgi:hypothetical protein